MGRNRKMYIDEPARYMSSDSLLATIEKLGMLVVERKKEIERLNTQITRLEEKLKKLQEEQK